MKTVLFILLVLAGCADSSESPDAVDQGMDQGSKTHDADTNNKQNGDMGLDGDAFLDANLEIDASTDAAVDAEVDTDIPAPLCPQTATCGALDPGATEHFAKSLVGCAFQLKKNDRFATAQAELQSIAGAGKGFVALENLNLNRTAQSGVTAQTAERLKNHDYFGFRWNAGDMATTDWYPQAITGNEDAGKGGRRLLVAWYDHTGATPEKGVRVSVIDLNTNPIRYRHILLVEPNGTSFGPVLTGAGTSLHGGGMVWYGDLLYVADTGNGFRVFDLSKIIEVTDTDDTDAIGVSGGRVDAFGYRYIAGQIARYTGTSEGCDIRFSFAGVDRQSDPPLIITGEYRADDAGGRLARWPMDADGWLHEDSDQVIRAKDAFVGAQTRMQGALSLGDALYISSSSQAGSLGRLYRTKVGQESKITAWVYGAEDLYYEGTQDRIWTPAEHPNARDVVSIPRQAP